MRVLVTGGAGYIGAHVVRLLATRGDHVVVIDDLVTGIHDRIGDVPLIRLDLATDYAIDELESALRHHAIDAVVHFAARKQVGESVARPAWYFRQNLGSLANLLIAMERAGVPRLVFSSSAAVYGPSETPIVETDATIPVNPYGETKLAGEWLVADSARAFGLRAVSLRYFNVAGAGWPELADQAALNLVPMVFEALARGAAPVIFGDDYPTPDGSCVRDYVHVLDVAEAHLATLDTLIDGGPGHEVFNVGSGRGVSVREMTEAILRVAGSEASVEIQDRRAGDPATVVANADSIRERLGWTARFGLDEIVESAWKARAQSPRP